MTPASDAVMSRRSEIALEGVHPDLVAVVRRASELGARFEITEGLRSLSRQRSLVAAGKSRTLRSRHLTGHAVDFVAIGADGKVTYEEGPMRGVARVMKKAAEGLDTPLEWGGDWQSFVDTPHLQLPFRYYPEGDAPAAIEITPKALAKGGSRIAAGAEQQKKDGIKGGAAEVVGHAAEIAGDAAGLAAGVAAKAAEKAQKIDVGQVAEQAGALQLNLETLEKFAVFLLAKGGLIGTGIALYFLARMAWKAGWIGTWRAQDASDGKTGM